MNRVKLTVLIMFMFTFHVVVVDLNGSGSATLNDDGSTEPEQSHHLATIHNQTGKLYGT